jgi:hypothetical protein
MSVETPPSTEQETPRELPGVPWVALVVVCGLLIAAVWFVMESLQSPELEWYTVSAIDPEEVGDSLVGPAVYTVDGRRNELTYFDFSTGSVIEGEPDPLGWDLAFRRFTIIANGGTGLSGQGGILDLGEVSLDSVTQVPTDGYETNPASAEVANAAIARWYKYSWTSHILKAKPKVFAVRTAHGRYAIFEILSYYCPGATAGCVTIRYLYQGAGGASFER